MFLVPTAIPVAYICWLLWLYAGCRRESTRSRVCQYWDVESKSLIDWSSSQLSRSSTTLWTRQIRQVCLHTCMLQLIARSHSCRLCLAIGA